MTFGLDNLPFGAVRTATGEQVAVVRYLDRLLDLSTLEPELFAAGGLDAFLAAGPVIWREVRAAAAAAIVADRTRLLDLGAVSPVLAYAVADYVDFYASEQHATNAGRIFRPDSPPLPPNWKRLPVGYHGRAGTVVVSGTPVRRPRGQYLDDADLVFGPSTRLDFEAEVAFVVGAASEPGDAVRPEASPTTCSA